MYVARRTPRCPFFPSPPVGETEAIAGNGRVMRSIWLLMAIKDRPSGGAETFGGMKRCPALQNLRANTTRRCRWPALCVAPRPAATELAAEAACNQACEVFRNELLPHFREEELCLLPRLEAAGAGAVVARTLIEHRALQRLVREPNS